MKQRIYIDTSVVGGYFDEEFKEATTMDRLDKNEIIFVVSDLLDLELINAPQHVQQLLHNYSAEKFQRIELTDESIKLADKYINEKVVGIKCRRLQTYCFSNYSQSRRISKLEF